MIQGPLQPFVPATADPQRCSWTETALLNGKTVVCHEIAITHVVVVQDASTAISMVLCDKHVRQKWRIPSRTRTYTHRRGPACGIPGTNFCPTHNHCTVICDDDES